MTVRVVLPYELRIGVTGHRDISGIAIDEAVGTLLDRIAATLRHPSVPLSWVVVSPLARGADRIVARVAMKRGARLEVVLPFPLNEYRKDFDPDEDLPEFETLFGQKSHVYDPPAIGTSGDRNEDYLRAGEEVVETCEILIALWDGQDSSGKGGTADIVQHARNVGRMVLWIRSAVPQHSVRLLDAAGEHDFPSTPETLSPGYAQQVAYCTDRSLDRTALEEKERAMRADLETEGEAAGLATSLWSTPVAPLVREHVRADQLALHYQSLHTGNVKRIVTLAAAAVTVGVTQVLFFTKYPELIALEVLCMLVVLALWWRGRRSALHQKWLRNRFLAERLRAAIFTTLTGAEADLIDQSMPFYGGPHHWMTRLVMAMSNTAAAPIRGLSLEPLQRFVATAWIEHQRRFHAKTFHHKKRDAHQKHGLVTFFFIATLVMAMLHLFHIGGNLVTALALVFPIWAGAIHTLMTQLEIERVAERSGRMASMLAHVHARILRARTPKELQLRTEQAATLMHDETHEWWVLLSFQDVRLQV